MAFALHSGALFVISQQVGSLLIPRWELNILFSRGCWSAAMAALGTFRTNYYRLDRSAVGGEADLLQACWLI
jgi:hypothetical protein